jgi:hypothetical protein
MLKSLLTMCHWSSTTWNTCLATSAERMMRAFSIAKMPEDFFRLDGVLALSANRYLQAFVSLKVLIGNSLWGVVR